MDHFEETLANLKREPLPPEWKDDLIATALSPELHEEKVARFPGPVTKIALGFIAACWIAAAILTVLTPSSPPSSPAITTIPKEQLPFIAQRLSEHYSLAYSN